GVATRQVHELPIGVAHRRRDVEQGLALGDVLAQGAVLPQREEAVSHAEAAAERAAMHYITHTVRLHGTSVPGVCTATTHRLLRHTQCQTPPPPPTPGFCTRPLRRWA